MQTTYRSDEKNEKGINKKLATVKEKSNGFTYVFTYEFPMTGTEQLTAHTKEGLRFEKKEDAEKFAKKFVGK